MAKKSLRQKKKSVSLKTEHIKAVEDFGRAIGVQSFSTALQAMIHQFQQLQANSATPATPPTPPENGTGPAKE